MRINVYHDRNGNMFDLPEGWPVPRLGDRIRHTAFKLGGIASLNGAKVKSVTHTPESDIIQIVVR